MQMCERCHEREALHTPTAVSQDGEIVREEYLCTVCQYMAIRSASAHRMVISFPNHELEHAQIEPHEPQSDA